jgi:hypothetical protein
MEPAIVETRDFHIVSKGMEEERVPAISETDVQACRLSLIWMLSLRWGCSLDT